MAKLSKALLQNSGTYLVWMVSIHVGEAWPHHMISYTYQGFLCHIIKLAISLQSKLLTLLEEYRYWRHGRIIEISIKGVKALRRYCHYTIFVIFGNIQNLHILVILYKVIVDLHCVVWITTLVSTQNKNTLNCLHYKFVMLAFHFYMNYVSTFKTFLQLWRGIWRKTWPTWWN